MSTPGPARGAVNESRDGRRFNAQPHLPAQFLSLPVSILNLSGGGLQIEHSEPFKLRTCGTVRVVEAYAGEAIEIPARVVWSHLSNNVDGSGKFRYRSGLDLFEPSESIIGALGRLIHAWGSPDAGSPDRKRQTIASRTDSPGIVQAIEVTPDQVERIRSARAYLQVHLDEAQKWYNRAKFSFANASGGDSAVRYRDEVLAIWEYTGRTISLRAILQSLDQTG